MKLEKEEKEKMLVNEIENKNDKIFQVILRACLEYSGFSKELKKATKQYLTNAENALLFKRALEETKIEDWEDYKEAMQVYKRYKEGE